MYTNRLKEFPTEIVEKMLECQVEQGNRKDVSIFENSSSESKTHGGFDWDKTSEDRNFWTRVIANKDFNVFFDKYPKTNLVQKEIIGYKLIKPEYKSAVNNILNLLSFNFERFEREFENYSCSILDLKKAGILDLWFEPVYKTEFKVGDWIIAEKATKPTADLIIEITNEYYKTKNQNIDALGFDKKRTDLRIATKEEIFEINKVTYTMGKSGTGTFELIVRDGKVFHKTEDITQYVKEVQRQYTSTVWKSKYVFGKYDFHVKDLILSKTGCENVETLLSQWVAIKL